MSIMGEGGILMMECKSDNESKKGRLKGCQGIKIKRAPLDKDKDYGICVYFYFFYFSYFSYFDTESHCSFSLHSPQDLSLLLPSTTSIYPSLPIVRICPSLLILSLSYNIIDLSNKRQENARNQRLAICHFRFTSFALVLWIR